MLSNEGAPMTLALTRRTVAAAMMSGAAAGPAFAQGAGDGRIAFQVLHSGSPIGSHEVRMRSTGDRQVASIVAQMVVKIGPITVFRYSHTGTETWEGSRFVSLVTRSVSNGKVETVDARATGDGVRIVRSGGATLTAAANAAPLTHWNRDALQRPLFNPQTGALLKCAVARRGVEAVRYGDGRSVQATAFVITGDADITDWYDADGAWAALKAKGPDGAQILYRRV